MLALLLLALGLREEEESQHEKKEGSQHEEEEKSQREKEESPGYSRLFPRVLFHRMIVV